MFRRMLLLSLATAVWPAASYAQRSQPEPPMPAGLSDSAQVLFRQLQGLLPEWRAMQREMQEYDKRRQREREEPLDTSRIGPFIVVAPIKESRTAFNGFQKAFDQRADLFEGLAASSTILVEVERPVPMYAFLQRGDRVHVTHIPDHGSAEQERILARVISESMSDFVSDTLRGWLSDGLRRAQAPALSYREIALARSRVVDQCEAGVAQGCLDALGLGDTTKMHWYTPEELRTRALRTYSLGSWHRWECKKTGSVAECMEALRPWGGPAAPLSSSVRGDFFKYVVERGGRGALARARSSGSPAAALSAAGNGDINNLTNDWRRDLFADARSARRSNASIGAVTLVWSVVFMFFSMRSTRRRSR